MTLGISVIIPLYNKGQHIARAINSVLNQTVQNFEIIIVDDQSSDEGPEIVRSYHDPRISFIEQDHRGVSGTRNHGVDLAKHDFIAFLDADDEWMPRFLETILRLIEKYPEAGLYTTAWKIGITEGNTQWPKFQGIPAYPWEGLLPDYFRSGALGDDPVMASDVVIPQEIFHKMGGFPQDYWYGEDTDLFGKIALKYPIAFSWEFGAIYHVDASNRSVEKRMPLDYEEPFVKTARSALMNGDVPEEIKESLDEFIAKKEIYRSYWNLHEGKIETARGIIQQCTTKLRKKEKITLLILTKLPSPLYLFLRDMRQHLIKIGQKK
jgi:glycosyltransferase involved in cell wall biosynthesis